MGNRVFIGMNATIVSGKCKGIDGEVVGADFCAKTIEIRVDPETTITTTWKNIKQNVVVCWNCGGVYDPDSEEVKAYEYIPRGSIFEGIHPDQEPVAVYKNCPHCMVSI